MQMDDARKIADWSTLEPERLNPIMEHYAEERALDAVVAGNTAVRLVLEFSSALSLVRLTAENLRTP